jgi:rhodanese-related sulfurtransferase
MTLDFHEKPSTNNYMLIDQTTHCSSTTRSIRAAFLAMTLSCMFMFTACAPQESADSESEGGDKESKSESASSVDGDNNETATPMIENVDVNKAAELLESNKDIVVLDVRTPEEFSSERIAGAINVDFRAANFAEKLADLDKNKTYLVHCAAGGRSAKSRDIMQKAGFTSIYHMDGGMGAWESAGKPVEK